MTRIPSVLRPDPASRTGRPSPSLFEILGTLGPADERSAASAPFRAACVLEAARRGRPAGPPRPTPHGAAPPVPPAG